MSNKQHPLQLEYSNQLFYQVIEIYDDLCCLMNLSISQAWSLYRERRKLPIHDHLIKAMDRQEVTGLTLLDLPGLVYATVLLLSSSHIYPTDSFLFLV